MLGFEKTIRLSFLGLKSGDKFSPKNISSALHLKTGEVVGPRVGPNLHQGKHSQCPSQTDCSHFGSRPGAYTPPEKTKFFHGQWETQKKITLAIFQEKRHG